MAVSQSANAMPNYVVYRETQPGEPLDPTSPLLFYPPKGSDELFDALRTAFPNTKTHSERMREAVIQYLLEERHEEQSQQTSPAMTMDSAFPSASTGRASSLLSSPETMELSTPASFATSPQPHMMHTARQGSIAMTSSHPSPLAIEQMTSVFSLSASNQPKQRFRRKMTEAEKVEYRKRRIVKACDKCAKRKRKCPHNQAEMEVVPSNSSKSSARKSNATLSKLKKPPPSHEIDFDLDPALFCMPELDTSVSFNPGELDFALFTNPSDDLNMTFMLPLDEVKPIDGYRPSNFFMQNPSPTQQDWTLDISLNLTSSDQLIANDDSWLSSLSPAYGTSDGASDLGQDWTQVFNTSTRTSAQSSESMISSNHSFSSTPGNVLQHAQMTQDGHPAIRRSQTGVLPQHVAGHAWQPIEAGLFDGDFVNYPLAQGRGTGNRMLWEHLRTGQEDFTSESDSASSRQNSPSPSSDKAVPTHTKHIHEPSRGATDEVDDTVRVKSPAGQQTPFASASVVQPTSEVLSERDQRRANRSRATEVATAGDRPTTGSVSTEDVLQAQPHTTSSPTNESRTRSQEDGSQNGVTLHSTHAQGVAATHTLSSGRSSSGTVQESPSPSNLVRRIISHRTPQHQQQDDRGDPSLGERLPENADPKMQLYMARKRMSVNLTTLVGRNMNAHLPTGAALAANPRLEARSTRGLPGETVLQQSTPSSPVAASCAAGQPQAIASSSARQLTPTASAERAATPAQDRLSDHNRFRDHHGRPAAALSTYLLTMFGCALLLHAAPLFAVNPVLLLAAALFIHTDGAPSSLLQQLLVQCTTKNSRWLAFASTASADGKDSAVRMVGAERRARLLVV